MTTAQQAIVVAAILAVCTAGGYLATPPPPSVIGKTPASTSLHPPSPATGPHHPRTGSGVPRSASLAALKPGRVDRTLSLMDYYHGLDSRQLAAEAEKLGKLPPAEVLIAACLLFNRWGELDPAAALARAGDNLAPPPKLGFLVPTILRSWASTDPVAAAAYCRGNPDAAQHIAAELAWQNPDAAMAWAKELDPNRRYTEVCIVRELARADPAKAWTMAGDVVEDYRVRAYGEVAGLWAAKDYNAVEKMIAALPIEQRGKVAAAAIEGLAVVDPVKAAAKCAAITDPMHRSMAERSVIDNWSRTAPADAAAWAVANVDEARLGVVLRDVMPGFVSMDPQAASAFVESMPGGKVRDFALDAYITNSLKDGTADSPEALVRLAGAMEDPGAKAKIMRQVVSIWRDRDSVAAENWLKANGGSSPPSPDKGESGEGGEDPPEPGASAKPIDPTFGSWFLEYNE